MSEYQYYEFQAIDRPLTDKEQAAVGALSSRAKLNSHQAIFLYNYGDFRGDPEKILTQYFDVMFYIANWGTWRLMFRLPRAIVDPDWFQPYCISDAISVSQTSKFVILDIEIHQEEGMRYWVEGEGWLSRLVPLRDDLLRADLRLLYLAWLRVVDSIAGAEWRDESLEDDPVEPPVPANLGALSKPLQAFIELVELNPDLVAAAAQSSSQAESAPEVPLETWLPSLSEAERQEFLLKLIRREPHVDLQLIQRLKQLSSQEHAITPRSSPGQRHFSELKDLSNHLSTQREQKQEAAARHKRQKELAALAPRESQIWEQVRRLIEFKQAKPYDEAVLLLLDLRDLAEQQGRSPEFAQRLQTLKSEFSNRPGLLTRLQKSKL